MAALRIAFEAPDSPGNSSTTGRKPIDLAHLAVQTMGDKALEIEVLQLFARQARQVMKEIVEGEGIHRAQAAHRLKGAALAVGAVDVAGVAGAIEQNPAEASLCDKLSTAVLEAELFILKLCR
ncbi:MULTISPECIES: Hpt domain-containing protein [unclassified Ensifer]|uniref:Hpt domain-containing protein n=1 Tax=unclassified Ensifer TaxID=2633371 RepID=UPI000813858A|nr:MULTISPECIES: Hpt domain-containing protein [unclassified Ensifer]OCP10305.1 transcriptional regulator [Ensifer sp. LC13]OCP11297.1 transcriptional regulator [Ensifer sp. LC11]OCP14626.1 transcriptional regulator [Ensifer sp. LC14]OCP33263.1 transcriptional regulator [Ensifer sp. LC499]